MLAALSVQDVVLIGGLTIDFAPGLCVLTGETGAGKSILLDAQNLALGLRAQPDLVVPGAKEASVSALFHLQAGHPVLALLAQKGIQHGEEEEIVLRRVQNAEGMSRGFINDVPVSINLLRQAGDMLAEIHGQNVRDELRQRGTHRFLLDSWGGYKIQLEKTAAAFEVWQEAEKASAYFNENQSKLVEQAEEAAAALAELDALAPEAGLEQKLAGERTLLQAGEKISGGLNEALGEIDSEEYGALVRLHRLSRMLEQLAAHAPGSLDTALAALNRASLELTEAREEAAALLHTITSDPEKLEKVEERLFSLRALARKHSVPVDELASLRKKLEQQVVEGGDAEKRRAELAARVQQAQKDYDAAASLLSAAREKAGGELSKAVNQELPALHLAHARFEVKLEEAEKPMASGKDHVRFLITTQPDAPPGGIERIASGGELSRFMLALKLVIAARSGARTLVFDEIDAGLSGAAAEAVGIRLARLAKMVQVLVVTHAPQIAAHATHHIRIVKNMQGEKFSATAQLLRGKEREEEIARMLSGVAITEEARAAARRLMAS